VRCKFTELLGDILKQRPLETDGLGSSIIVDNLPVVQIDKFDKLKSVINRLLKKCGTIINQDYPIDEKNGKTQG